jgi:hypothetical protein
VLKVAAPEASSIRRCSGALTLISSVLQLFLWLDHYGASSRLQRKFDVQNLKLNVHPRSISPAFVIPPQPK